MKRHILTLVVLSLLIATNGMAQEKAEEQLMLGGKYFKEENYELAVYWWTKAADQGYDEAQLDDGTFVIDLDPVVEDRCKAEWGIDNVPNKGIYNKEENCILLTHSGNSM